MEQKITNVAELFRAVEGVLPPVNRTWQYRLALYVVTLFMILLPMVVLATVAFLVWALIAYLIHVLPAFFTAEKSRGLMEICAILTVPCGLLLIIFLMIKPFFTGGKSRDYRFELFRDEEPFFYDFIERLSKHMGAKPPKRVFLSCEVNASASPTYGLFGAIFGRHRCDLTMGLPLIVGMQTEELSCVLAHEFGHFAQAADLRCSVIIGTIQSWFVQVIFGSDEVDKKIFAAIHCNVIYIVFPALVIFLLVKLVRGYLWLLLLLATMASRYLSRHGEFDADTYAIRLVGTERFITMLRKLTDLSIAEYKTINDLENSLQKGILPDDIPELIAANVHLLRARLDEWANQNTNPEKTHWYDTHPSHEQRQAAAERWAAKPEFVCDIPARFLLKNIKDRSRACTRHFFETHLDMKTIATQVGPIRYCSSDVIASELKQDYSAAEYCSVYFMQIPPGPVFFTLPLPDLTPATDLAASRQRLSQIFRTLQSTNRDKLRQSCEDYLTLRYTVAGYQLAEQLLKQHQPVAWKCFPDKVTPVNKTSCPARLAEVEEAYRKLHTQFGQWNDLSGKRLWLGLSLYLSEEHAEKDREGILLPSREKVLLMYELYRQIGSFRNGYMEYYKKICLIQMILSYAHNLSGLKKKVPDALDSMFISTMNSTQPFLKKLTSNYSTILYPFVSGAETVTVADRIFPGFRQNLENLIESGCLLEYMEAYETFADQVLQQLVLAATEVERSLGLDTEADSGKK